jgi:DNA-directed RNA polymerase II subunit RPB1
VHLPQLLTHQDPPGIPHPTQNDAQQDKFNRLKHIAQPTKRLNELAKLLAPISRCTAQEYEKDSGSETYVGGCGATIPTKVALRNHRIIIDEKQEVTGDQTKKKKETTYTALRVRNIFNKISVADCKILGFTVTKPVDLLIETLAVAPPQIRPSIEMNPEKKAEDEITSAYVRIVSINNELKSQVEANQRDMKVQEMEKIVASIMVKVDRVNLQKPGGGKKKKVMKKIKSIEERLKSKEGRFRQHLMGKRVDFSARSVVSPDSNLALDELGVPEKVAAALTIPEEVTEINYDRMIKLCAEGKVKYIIKPSE